LRIPISLLNDKKEKKEKTQNLQKWRLSRQETGYQLKNELKTVRGSKSTQKASLGYVRRFQGHAKNTEVKKDD